MILNREFANNFFFERTNTIFVLRCQILLRRSVNFTITIKFQ